MQIPSQDSRQDSRFTWIVFSTAGLFWLGFSGWLLVTALTGLYAPLSLLAASTSWMLTLSQVGLLWLSLLCAGVGLAHLALTSKQGVSLANIQNLWKDLPRHQWELLGLILVLSYAALAFMVYVIQKNAGIGGQLLLAVTCAALIMFGREISYQALYGAEGIREKF